MDKDAFYFHIKSLEDQYGKNNYSMSKKDLILSKVLACENDDVYYAIQDLLLDCKYAPTGKEIIDAIWHQKHRRKARESQEGANSLPGTTEDRKSVFEFSELSLIVGNTIKKVEGFLSDNDWKATIDYVTKTLEANKDKLPKPICNKCQDKGYIFKEIDSYEYMQKCGCK